MRRNESRFQRWRLGLHGFPGRCPRLGLCRAFGAKYMATGSGCPTRLRNAKLVAVTMERTARSIAAKLREQGHIAYFAGGCVRDMVRKLGPKDIDIATDARPEEVQKLFPRTYAVGAHFGVIVVLENQFQFEVATFRSDDVYLDGRRPSEVHFSSPEEDARRRDFTINGML